VSVVIIAKLAGIFAVVAVGFAAGRTRMFGGAEPVHLLTNLAFYILAPALLYRLTARIDLGALPWVVIAVYFGPAVGLLLVVYAWSRRRMRAAGGDASRRPARPGSAVTGRPRAPVAAPSIRAVSTAFGNTVQLGIPIVVALFGDTGLAVHVAIVSLHAVTLLTIITVLVELDLSRASAADNADADGAQEGPSIAATALTTARRAVVHPVVLPVLLGLIANVIGLPLPGPVDDVLATLGQAVVPLCLILIGLSLAHYGLRGVGWAALWLSTGKLVVLPALVLAAAYAAGLRGTPLSVTVLCAALPIGSNPLLFAQRYGALEAETTAALVASTLAFVVTAPVWLWAAATLG
jgi:predicted permease